ncbi:MAG: ABC transporter ATP-binding protein [Calditrichia bacterium]|nr:ABC transporter ATP-binding protein [Calditrichia bacterium]
MVDKSTNKNINLYLRIIAYLKPYYKHIIGVLICNLGFVISSMLTVWMVAPVISVIFQNFDQEQVQQIPETAPAEGVDVSFFNLNEWLKENIQGMIPLGDPVETLKWLCIFVVLIFVVKNIFNFAEHFWITYVEQRVVKDLREQLYESIIYQSMSFFHKHKTGDLISNITNDINAVNLAFNRSFTKIIRDPVLILIYLAILTSISWKLTLIAALVLPITSGFIRKIGNSLKRKSHRVQERIAEITTVLQETISGIKVVKAFAMEKYENKKFGSFVSDHFRAIVRQVRLQRLAGPLSETLGVFVMACVIWYGGNMVLQGQSLSSEDFIRFLIILFSVLDPIKSLSDLNNNVQIALASGKRIFDVMDEHDPIIEKPNATVKQSFESLISYKDVLFRYTVDSNLVLNNISLDVQKNQKIAFVGSSGGGKTTLVNLLPRFYDVSSGSIRIDGIDVRDMAVTSLRNLMGIVTQEVILFNDTVANNIAYGLDKYSVEEIENAAKLANAYDFIMELPDAFQTLIGERGMLVSGGQRQRISIARAILKNPPILIFDEATSSLDSESESLIQQAIENLMKDRTVFVIAHRLSSVINSDIIIVMEDGQLIDKGSNDELLERSERYRQLYDLQFAP